MRSRPWFSRSLRIPAFVLPLALAMSVSAAPEWDITVIGDMTEAGRKFPRPTRENPTVYVPLVVGHREEGGVLAGEVPPPAREVILRQVAVTLAENHFLVASENRPPPTLLLLVSWGSLSPNLLTLEVPAVGSSATGDPTGETTEVKQFLNPAMMRALVAGNTPKNFAFTPREFTNHDWDAVYSEMQQDRYFVSVVAFDWVAARAKKRVLLWATKMSIHSKGVTLSDVAKALIKSGGPMFGRETQKPVYISLPAPVRDGKVDVGTPVIVPGGDSSKPSTGGPANPRKK